MLKIYKFYFIRISININSIYKVMIKLATKVFITQRIRKFMNCFFCS